MKTVLVIAVGGASAPIVTAIRDHNPDRVVFIATLNQPGRPGSQTAVEGKGNVSDVRAEQKCPYCKQIITPRQAKPSIVVQTGLRSEQYRIVTVTPDDLYECYATCKHVLSELREDDPDIRIVADYTGGTKTMSAALILAALERGDCELSLVQGQRTDLIRVADGTEMSMAIDTLGLLAHRRIALAEELFDGFAYQSAQSTLEDLARGAALPAALRNDIQRRVQLCRGFDAWDRFDHPLAAQLLKPFVRQLGDHWKYLLALNQKGQYTGYEAVFDLICNAERRVAQARYDDATARLYRAVELMAQRRLASHYDLDTGNLDVHKLPEDLRPLYERERDGEDGRIRLGLQEAYLLLSKLADPLGKAYDTVRNPLSNVLKLRNSSILAHGTAPVGEDGYKQLVVQVARLIDNVRSDLQLGLNPEQFPKLREIQP